MASCYRAKRCVQSNWELVVLKARRWAHKEADKIGKNITGWDAAAEKLLKTLGV